MKNKQENIISNKLSFIFLSMLIFALAVALVNAEPMTIAEGTTDWDAVFGELWNTTVVGNPNATYFDFNVTGIFNATTPITDESIADDITLQTTKEVTIGGGFGAGGITLTTDGTGSFAQNILIAGNLTLVNEVSANTSILPFIDATFLLGNGSNRWLSGNFSDVVEVGSLTATTIRTTNLQDEDNTNFFDLAGCGTGATFTALDQTGAVTCSSISITESQISDLSHAIFTLGNISNSTGAASMANEDFGEFTCNGAGACIIDSGVIDNDNIGVNAVQVSELDITDVSDNIAADFAEGELADNIIVTADIKDGEVQIGDIGVDAVSDSELDGGFSWTLDADLNIDSNTLVIDESANLVGIGTPTPSSSLEVTGNFTVLAPNATIANVSIMNFNSTCGGFRFKTGGTFLSCTD